MNVLVVPTIRENCIIEFLKKWKNPWEHIIVVEDNPKKTIDFSKLFNLDCENVDLELSEFYNISHFSWEEIDKDLGENSWIISRRDSAIRSYGFLKAYQMGATHIFTLDDDCLPSYDFNPESFTTEHLNNLYSMPVWTESILGQRTRGLPYRNLGTLKNVVMSVGFWQGNPDFDAIQTLSNQNENINLPETAILPYGQFTPICGMNLAFKREITPLCMFAPSGQGYPYRRFDDIWFGIIAKKICDHLGLLIATGKPYIYHSKASDPFVNLVKEAPGVAYNENFWKVIYDLELKSKNLVDVVKEIGIKLTLEKDDYAKKYGESLQIWSSLFKE